MDDLTKGTWLLNSYKHLLNIHQTAPELHNFNATITAGKAGALLAKLVADHSEVVAYDRIRAFAQSAGITKFELNSYLTLLKEQNKIDFSNSATPQVEIYCFSLQDAIVATGEMFDSLDCGNCERANLSVLDKTFQLPLSDDEVIDLLTDAGFSENEANSTLQLEESTGLIKVSRSSSQPIIYNEYAFAGNEEKIFKALQSLSPSDRQMVLDIQEIVDQSPGYSLDALMSKFPTRTIKLMEGVGLLDGITIKSTYGQATFVVRPQSRGISINTPWVSADVFHKAKLLLSCLRFGQVKSDDWRGKIQSQAKLLNIVDKLVRGSWVGECTAIGQDYIVLEAEGVVETKPGTSAGQFFLKLRQKEVGDLVSKMVRYNHVAANIAGFGDILSNAKVQDYENPEQRRTQITTKLSKPVQEARDNLLLAIRTTSVRRK